MSLAEAVVYARVSTTNQICGTLLECAATVTFGGWTAQEYVDVGVSGVLVHADAGVAHLYGDKAPAAAAPTLDATGEHKISKTS
jgi:hypothetical protein